jgi:phosphoribosylanthranilate isomerase
MRVKVCGLTRSEDVAWAAEQGADFLGVVCEPSSPRFVEQPYQILRAVAATGLPSVAVFGPYRQEFRPVGFDVIQSVTSPSQGVPPVWWPVIRARPEDQVDRWLGLARGHAVVVLDPFDPHLHGGTGKTLDWGSAREFAQEFPGKLILAGGLNPENVADAVTQVGPWAVDASSGLEIAPGVKDHIRVWEFIRRARGQQ